MPEGWSEFFLATAGAAAALAGLIIVAMTTNIRTVLSIPAMPSRAGATIASLVLIVVCTAAGLIPGQAIELLEERSSSSRPARRCWPRTRHAQC